jgi:hypothetical protein
MANANTWTALQTFGNASTTNIGSTGSAYLATAGGNVGIGETSPLAALSLKRTANQTVAGKFSDSYISLYDPTVIGDYSQFTFGYTTGPSTYGAAYMGYLSTNQGGNGYGDLVFGTRAVNTDTQPSERMRILSNGNVGIGTSTPNALLQLFSSATTTMSLDSGSATQGSCIEMKDKSGTGYTYIYAEDGVIYSSTISCK